MWEISSRGRFRLLPMLAVALSLTLSLAFGGISFARDRAETEPGLAWFHGSWNLAYIDRGLGVVPGRADVTAAAEPGSDEPSINANVRLSHPHTGQIYTLTLDSHSIEGNFLVLNLNGQSPASEIVEMAGLGETVGEAIPLEIDPGEQLEAAYGGETATATIAPEILLPRPHQVTIRLTIPDSGEPNPLEGTWSSAYGAATEMRQSRAGTYDAAEGRASGRETWGRSAPRITGVTDVDMPSQRDLAETHQQTQRRGERPIWLRPEREAAHTALVAEYGEDAYTRFWLRIDGVDLPVQPRRKVEVSFDNEKIVWTGEHRSNEQNPQSLDIEVVLKKGLVAGIHTLSLNAVPGQWQYNLEPAQIRYMRLVSPAETPEELPTGVAAGDERPAQYEAVNELYLGETFRVELEYLNEPPFDTRQVGSMAGPGNVVTYDAEKQPDRPNLFRSKPILIDAPRPEAGGSVANEEVSGAASERPTVTITAADGNHLLTTEIDSAVSDRGRQAGIAHVLGSPPSLWQSALERAEKCRAQGRSETDVTNYIFHEILLEQFRPVVGQFRTIWRLFGNGPPLRITQRLTISLEDHAAAILLRDELAAALTDYADGELQSFGSQSGGTPSLDRRSYAVLNAYTAEMIGAARSVLTPQRYDGLLLTDVHVPPGTPPVDGSYLVPLRRALGGVAEARLFAGDRARFFEYANIAVGEARLALARRAERSVGFASRPTDCQVVEILARVRPAAAVIAQRVMPKLLRSPNGTEPRLPRWLPDRLARSFVTYVKILASAIKAQKEYSSYDTDVSLAIANVAFTAVGVGVRLAVEAGAATVTAVNAVTTAGRVLDAIDAGVWGLRDLPAYGKALDDLQYAEGLVGIAGREQLEEAKQEAEAAALTAIVGGVLLGGQKAVAGLSHAKKAVGAVPSPKLQDNAAKIADAPKPQPDKGLDAGEPSKVADWSAPKHGKSPDAEVPSKVADWSMPKPDKSPDASQPSKVADWSTPKPDKGPAADAPPKSDPSAASAQPSSPPASPSSGLGSSDIVLSSLPAPAGVIPLAGPNASTGWQLIPGPTLRWNSPFGDLHMDNNVFAMGGFADVHRLLDANGKPSGFLIKRYSEKTGKFGRGSDPHRLDDQRRMVADTNYGAALLKRENILQAEIQGLDPHAPGAGYVIQREVGHPNHLPQGVNREFMLSDIVSPNSPNRRALAHDERNALGLLFRKLIDGNIGWEDSHAGNIFVRVYDNKTIEMGIHDTDRIADFTNIDANRDLVFEYFRKNMQNDPASNRINSMEPGMPILNARDFTYKNFERKGWIYYIPKIGILPGRMDLKTMHRIFPDLPDSLPPGWPAGPDWDAAARGKQSRILIFPDKRQVARDDHGPPLDRRAASARRWLNLALAA